MSYSYQPNVEGRGGRLTSVNLSGARDVESTKVMSNEMGEEVHHSLTLEPCLNHVCVNPVCGGPDTTVVDQRSARIETTDSEMFIAEASSTLKRKRKRVRISQSQSATTQATTTSSSSRRQRMIEQQRRGLLDLEIGRIRQRYYEQEKILEREIEKLERMYESAMKQLEEQEEEEEEDNSESVAGLWEVQSTYAKTEPDPDNPDNGELEQQGLGRPSTCAPESGKWCSVADQHVENRHS